MSNADAAPPALTFFAAVDVDVGPAHEVGATAAGNRRIVPILGGTVRAAGWRGRVVPGGADFQAVVTPTMAVLDARYLIETEAGELIYIVNHGIRVASAEVTARLVRGEPVAPAQVYFRCLPRLETSAPSLAWINERLFVGTGVRTPGQVRLQLFTIE